LIQLLVLVLADDLEAMAAAPRVSVAAGADDGAADGADAIADAPSVSVAPCAVRITSPAFFILSAGALPVIAGELAAIPNFGSGVSGVLAGFAAPPVSVSSAAVGAGLAGAYPAAVPCTDGSASIRLISCRKFISIPWFFCLPGVIFLLTLYLLILEVLCVDL
jgi:hypothetical protein